MHAVPYAKDKNVEKKKNENLGGVKYFGNKIEMTRVLLAYA